MESWDGIKPLKEEFNRFKLKDDRNVIFILKTINSKIIIHKNINEIITAQELFEKCDKISLVVDHCLVFNIGKEISKDGNSHVVNFGNVFIEKRI